MNAPVEQMYTNIPQISCFAWENDKDETTSYLPSWTTSEQDYNLVRFGKEVHGFFFNDPLLATA